MLGLHSKTELAWAAGFFDGEGCTFSNGRDYPRMVVTQMDRRPLDRFAAAVHFGHVRSRPKVGGWEWVCNDWQDVRKVHALLWPYLSEPKREQANAKWDTFDERRRRDPGIGQGRKRERRNDQLSHLLGTA